MVRLCKLTLPEQCRGAPTHLLIFMHVKGKHACWCALYVLVRVTSHWG